MVVLMLLVLCNMVVSCSAFDCASRYTKGSGVGLFFDFRSILQDVVCGSQRFGAGKLTAQREYLASGIEFVVGTSSLVGLIQRRHILILHRTSNWDTWHHRAWACERHRFKKRPSRVLLSHLRSFLLAFGDLKEQGRDAGPPLCLLSRRAKANGTFSGDGKDVRGRWVRSYVRLQFELGCRADGWSQSPGPSWFSSPSSSTKSTAIHFKVPLWRCHVSGSRSRHGVVV